MRSAAGGIKAVPPKDPAICRPDSQLKKKKVLFRQTGSAHVGAVLIAVQARRLCSGNARLETVQRREGIVSIEPPGAAVECVGAALGGEIHLAAGRAADFGRVGAALHLELH